MKNLSNITYVLIDGRKDYNLFYPILYAEYASKYFTFGKFLILTPDSQKYKHEFIEFREIPPLDYLGYSYFMVESFYKYIDTDFCLVYQEDGAIYNPNLWDDKFLEYDYIGAPWPKGSHPWQNRKIAVGNGGFSIRSKKYLEVASKLKFQPHRRMRGGGCEDIFTVCMNREFLLNHNVTIADYQLARKFALENPLDDQHTIDKCFGFHQKRSRYYQSTELTDSYKTKVMKELNHECKLC